MIYMRPPTEAEHHELRRMTCQEIGRVSQRAPMILRSAQRRTVPEMATLFDSSRATWRRSGPWRCWCWPLSNTV